MARRILLALLLGLLAGGCASEGSGRRREGGLAARGPRLLVFELTVNPNGTIDTSGRGYYVILFNAQGEAIEVTDLDTFTDFIRFDGTNVNWFHRLGNAPNPGFTFVNAGTLNAVSSLSEDGRTWRVVLDAGDPGNFLSQFVAAATFTIQVVTTDSFQGAIIGRVLDTLGQGPDLDGNSLNTVTVRKGAGPVGPLPPFFPGDALNDFITHSGLGADFPYPNFDIATFQVTAR